MSCVYVISRLTVTKSLLRNLLKHHVSHQSKCVYNSLLAFLDCLIKVDTEHKLSTVVYRKPTHTDHYLQFGSHHTLVHKLGVIRTLHYRADTIISDSNAVADEKAHVEGALKPCGYPNWTFQKAKKSKPVVSTKEPNSNQADDKPRVHITSPILRGSPRGLRTA